MTARLAVAVEALRRRGYRVEQRQNGCWVVELHGLVADNLADADFVAFARKAGVVVLSEAPE